jgi:anti-sigma factor RsiW
MNCELAHERLVTAAYGELPDEQIHELDRHLLGCTECAAEREQLQALRVLADAYPVLEPDANLVARSRMRLDEALDAIPPRSWMQRFRQRILNGFSSLTAAPLAAGLLLLLGVGGGGLGGFKFAENRAARAAEAQRLAQARVQQTAPAEVASISSVIRQPNSSMVEVHYNQLVPQQIQGSVNDPQIRQLLMLASQNTTSAGMRDDSVGLLAAECRASHGCRATGIRDALMVALRYDKNAGVREKALKGLEPYVAEDQQVRNAILEALLNDSDAHIRTAAINLLQPVDADTSVRQVLHTVANTDENPYIRTVSRQVLNQMPEIQ